MHEINCQIKEKFPPMHSFNRRLEEQFAILSMSRGHGRELTGIIVSSAEMYGSVLSEVTRAWPYSLKTTKLTNFWKNCSLFLNFKKEIENSFL